MKIFMTFIVGAMLSQSLLAGTCANNPLVSQVAQFDLSGKVNFENKPSGEKNQILLVKHSKGDEVYEYIQSELSKDFELISSVYSGQDAAIFFTFEKSTCSVAMMITAGDEPAVYAVDALFENLMSLHDIYNNERLILIKE